MFSIYTITLVVGIALGVFVVSHVLAYLRSPLKDIPGPFLAKFTNIWRFIDHYKATQISTQRRLHATLGPAVRIGPNFVSLSDPTLLKTIYSTRGEYAKSDFYSVNDAVQNGQVIQNIFGTRSNAFHNRYIRPIQKLYSMNSMLAMEGLVDKAIRSMCKQLESRFVDGKNTNKPCNLTDWIEFYAWDVLGEVTFSKDFGFLRGGCDQMDLIQTAESTMRYFGVVGQMPVLDRFLGKNPWLSGPRSPISFPSFGRAAGFCFEQLAERLGGSSSSSDLEKEAGRQDFLREFLRAKEENPGIVTDNEVLGYLLLNMLAGADTTAIAQKGIIYHLLRNPPAQAKLRAELDAAGVSFPASFAETRDLGYLDAVVKEGLRMHAPIGNILERVVPASGLELRDGRVIAPGTIVGMNQWVVSRNKEVYGDDADSFRPERWLRADGETAVAYEARLKMMKEGDLSFGGGNRICTGRHMAFMEMFKVTATLFSRYNIELEDPSMDWTLQLWWFVFTKNVRVRITRRE
ncbi:benzoate 4-monooxygenase cytochrome P450 [Diaporthe helianthi]|uniref:Benzoate 4-monooxygenase cytochrome P450 n=1 Tax=Diaporthe helianthi TaxID=158607 RepID=A0A2P5IEX6_DIAHE|nr:benzoate 4-monooxygenase cytochrome P450 [Diaporthe helianthi]